MHSRLWVAEFHPVNACLGRARETQAAMEMLQCNGGIEAARNDLNRVSERSRAVCARLTSAEHARCSAIRTTCSGASPQKLQLSRRRGTRAAFTGSRYAPQLDGARAISSLGGGYAGTAFARS
eukprot:scaffold17554_cov95-Phaeocystis_antarctica.AAC.1